MSQGWPAESGRVLISTETRGHKLQWNVFYFGKNSKNVRLWHMLLVEAFDLID